MLYQNEEPLVQRTCIKTANLQSDTNTSDKLETQELPPGGVTTKIITSGGAEITNSHLWPSGLNVLVGQESRVHLSTAEYADPDGGISAVVRR